MMNGLEPLNLTGIQKEKPKGVDETHHYLCKLLATLILLLTCADLQ